MPTLSTHAGFGDDVLRAQWLELLEIDPEASVFQGPRFLQTWHDVLGTDHDVTTVALHDGDDLVGIVAEARSELDDGRTVVEFAGGNEVTDYQGPVARPDAAKELATAWAERLASLDVDELVLSGLPDDSGWCDLLAAALQDRGMAVDDPVQVDVAPVIDLSDGHDAWLAALSSKDRKEHRRKARRLARDLGAVEVVTVDEGLHDAIEQFFGMNGDAASPKASFFDRDDMRAFFDGLADEYHDDGVFRLHQLTVAGRPVAANVSLVWRDRWGLYNSAFDPRMSSFSPGNVLVAELIELAGDEGVATFDLLRGDEAYKYRFGAVDRDVVRLTARPAGR